MLHRVKDLSADQRLVAEVLLGHPLSEGESLSIRSISETDMLPDGLPGEKMREALDRLDGYFASIDAKRMPISEDEEPSIIDEALRSTRPHYRPID